MKTVGLFSRWPGSDSSYQSSPQQVSEQCLMPDRERHPTLPRSNPVLSPAPPRVENRLQTHTSDPGGIRHGVWDLVSRGIPGHSPHIADVTLADLCISII